MDSFIIYLIGISAVLFFVIILVYFFIAKKSNTYDSKLVNQLTSGTKQKKFTAEIVYQRLYVFFSGIPLYNRYLFKIRRRLEIINIEDEYLTRHQTSKIITNTTIIAIIVVFIIISFTKQNMLLRGILLIFELFFIETIMDGMADKIDNRLLRQQVDFFSEIRHAYHEFNMVEEAIYEVSLNDELEVARQAEKIYEILISDDPETNLEKYYDVAPNSYLKEFAGVSYLTKEFGDRKVAGSSLYLKNLNNITQEMQLEILKRDKLDYVFQSLSIIAAIPVLLLDVVKNWSVSQFSFTDQFYSGKLGFIAQILIILITVICYMLIRKIKDNGSIVTARSDNPWQAKLYAKKTFKKLFDLIIPKKGTKEYRKTILLLKESASKQKMEWLYVTKVIVLIATFFISLVLFFQLHKITVDYVRTEPVKDFNILGNMSANDLKKGLQLTELDNKILDKLSTKNSVTLIVVEKMIKSTEYYAKSTDEEIATAAERVYNKYLLIHKENLQWFEIILAMAFAALAYFAPNWILVFQKKMRQLEMENEVMQFQTIILMLMKIERVNVEMILEWIERYANIFKEPISKCVNNYESGAWEALEELKGDIAYMPLIRLVESMQAAVEKIPIVDAFDELDTERAYYQEKRKESNERLIATKGMIGKGLGFAPMIILFVGYLIVPLVVIGLLSMTSAFSTMSAI